jgi:hypothetical protein
MNLSFPFRTELAAVSQYLVEAFDQVVSQIQSGWNVEHKEDGTHADVTAETVTADQIVTDRVLVGNGTVAAPSLSCQNSTSSGIYFEPDPPTPRLYMALNGAMRVELTTAELEVQGPLITTGDIFTVAGSSVIINAPFNTKSTTGLTIAQGTADDEIVSLKSSDIAHGMTDLTETDTYLFITKTSPTDGGALVRSLAESSTLSMILACTAGSGDTAKSTSATAPFYVSADKKNTTTVQAMGANENIAAFTNSGTTRFILDGHGVDKLR